MTNNKQNNLFDFNLAIQNILDGKTLQTDQKAGNAIITKRYRPVTR